MVLDGTVLFSNLAIIKRTNFTNNICHSPDGRCGGSSINLESNARVDQVTDNAKIYNW